MISLDNKRILVLSPHTDDGELSSGGTIIRSLSEGSEVFYTAFSSCEKSVPVGYDCNVLKRECLAATHHLGIQKSNVKLLNFEVREFTDNRQLILDEIIQLKKDIHPDIVIVPSSFDVHQDHQVIHNEAIRAFKMEASILGMEHPWNNLTFRSDVSVTLTEKQVNQKILALQEYKSQTNRDYFGHDYIMSLARTRGLNVHSPFAEVFECIRIIV